MNAATLAALESQLPMLRRRERMAFWWAVGFAGVGLLGIGLQVAAFFVMQRAVSSLGPANPSPQQLAEAMKGGVAMTMGSMGLIIGGGVGLLISLLIWLLTMRRRRQAEGQLLEIVAAGGRRV